MKSGFRSRSREEVGSSRVVSIQRGTDRFAGHRAVAVTEYQPMEVMREHARRIRHHTLDHLRFYLEQFTDRAEAAGARVHFAADREEAAAIAGRLVEGAGTVVKSKSMLSEEIGLNEHLAGLDLEVVETDLGEFIIQLSGETPTHIIAPALHKDRFEIGRLFTERLGVAYTDVPSELNQIARRHLRRVFLSAGAGISGVNFGVAATGSVVTVTNEGNGRLTTTAPPVHVAVMGAERLVPGFGELAVMLEVLARSATGQRLSVYTNVITGPRRPGEPDGPEEVHIVVVDNGRTALAGGPYQEMLACIRCGACLNVCPVYRQVGGHGYGSPYSGPMGAVLTPLLLGRRDWGDLAYASTLCGACVDACPVRIDIPRMLVALRQEEAAAGRLDPVVARGVKLYAVMAATPRRYRWWWRLVRLALAPFRGGEWLGGLPGPGRRWTGRRFLRRPAGQTFSRRWRRHGTR